MDNVRCIAFDFDGVIADSLPAQEEIWRQVARSVLGNASLEETLVDNLYRGKSKEGMFENMPITKHQAQELREKKDKAWLQQGRDTRLIKGAKENLPLIRRSYAVAIATTADRQYVEAILSRERLRDFVNVIVTDGEVERTKPAPDLLCEICRQLSITIEEICLVGDSEADWEMSERARCRFILFAPDKKSESDLPSSYVRDWIGLAGALGCSLT